MFLDLDVYSVQKDTAIGNKPQKVRNEKEVNVIINLLEVPMFLHQL